MKNSEYICPFCKTILVLNKKDDLDYCDNKLCTNKYTIDDLYEEYIINDNCNQYLISIRKNTSFLFFVNEDEVKNMGHFFNVKELELQGKSAEEVNLVIKKIVKLHNIKIFW